MNTLVTICTHEISVGPSPTFMGQHLLNSATKGVFLGLA
jgi:hypothetical protein